MEKTLIIADASLFKEGACILRTFYTAVKGYKAKRNYNDIDFGSAVHKFKAHWRNDPSDMGYMVGIQLAKQSYAKADFHIKSNKKYLTAEFLQMACQGYASKYRDDSFKTVPIPHDWNFNGVVIPKGTNLIEPVTRFAFPYYVDDEVEILIAGTMDEIGKYVGGSYCIADLKTTSVWNSDEYFKGFDLSPQLLTYRWALRRYAEAYPDSFLAEIDKAGCGAIIDGVFYAGADKPIEYKRSKIYLFKERDLEEFTGLVHKFVHVDLIPAVKHWRKTGIIPPRYGILNGACTTPYGPCKFAEVCRMPDESRMSVLEGSFKTQDYNPLLFGE
jgi:hypothetical protein